MPKFSAAAGNISRNVGMICPPDRSSDVWLWLPEFWPNAPAVPRSRVFASWNSDDPLLLPVLLLSYDERVGERKSPLEPAVFGNSAEKVIKWSLQKRNVPVVLTPSALLSGGPEPCPFIVGNALRKFSRAGANMFVMLWLSMSDGEPSNGSGCTSGRPGLDLTQVPTLVDRKCESLLDPEFLCSKNEFRFSLEKFLHRHSSEIIVFAQGRCIFCENSRKD